jgi:nucleoside 2-deoxyribosyltransferase
MTDSKNRKRVYISGPYSGGKWGTNIKRAVEEAEAVAEAGHVPFIPHSMTALWSILHEKSGEEWLEQDYSWIEACDALIRIPGESPGGDKEVMYASSLNMPIYSSADSFLEAQGENVFIEQ